MRKLLPLAAAIVALAPAGAASAAPVTGVVVGAHQGTLLVASSNGTVRALAGHARIGARISVAAGHVTVLGRAHRALVTGVVIRHRAGLTFLSTAGHVLVIHKASRSLASARDTQPAPGSVVQATVGFDQQGDLDDQGEDVVGQAANAEVQATVTAVAAGSVTLSVNGQTLTIPLPAGLTLPATVVGTQVTLKVDFGAAGATVASGGVTSGDDEQDDDGNAGTTAPSGTSASIVPQSGHGDGGHHDGGGGDD